MAYGKAIKIPRTEVHNCDREDMKGAGVYFLFCQEEDGDASVYHARNFYINPQPLVNKNTAQQLVLFVIRLYCSILFRLKVCNFYYFLASFGLFAPYLERACLLLATPAVSRVPRTMWYLVPGRSFTRPPRIRTTLCS